MKRYIIYALLAASIVCVMLVTASCSAQVDESGAANATPGSTLIDSGELNNMTGLNAAHTLSGDDGKYVSLYVENKGPNEVVVSINGSGAKTLEPGGKGSVCVEVTQGSSDGDAEYVFKVSTGKDGGIVDISYEITQQETDTSARG